MGSRLVLTVVWLVAFAMPVRGGDCPEGDGRVFIDSDGAADGQLDIPVLPGGTGSFLVTVRLKTAFESDRDFVAVGGWAVAVAHDPELLTVEEFSTDDTLRQVVGIQMQGTERAARDDDVGFLDWTFTTCGVDDCHLPLEGEYEIVRVRYSYSVPENATGPITTTLRFRDGLQGSGQPVDNVFTIDGQSWRPCMDDLEIRFAIPPEQPFARGDANFDGNLDVSDPVTVLRANFHGDATIHCADAADANDDGGVDVSDAVYLFGYLFLGGPAPAAPFPEPGDDPTPDAISCRPFGFS